MITGIGDFSGENAHFTGILFGLSAAVLYASVILMNKFIKSVEGIPRTLLQFCAAILVLFPYVFFTSGINLPLLQGKGLLSLLIVGIVHTGMNYCIYFSTLKELPGQKAAILSYLDPLTAVVVSVVVLGESISFLQLVGGLCILGFTLWNELSS